MTTKNPAAFLRQPRGVLTPGRTPGTPATPKAAQRAPEAKEKTPQTALAELRAEQTVRVRRLNEREAGAMAPVEDTQREWESICAEIRVAMLAVPARIAAKHPGHDRIVADLDAEIRAALHGLADDAL